MISAAAASNSARRSAAASRRAPRAGRRRRIAWIGPRLTGVDMVFSPILQVVS